MINIEDFDSSLLKIDKKKTVQKYCYLLHWIHHNKKLNDYESIHSINPLYLIISKADGRIKEKKMGVNV